VLQFHSFDSGYSLVVLSKDFLSGGEERGSDITKFFHPNNQNQMNGTGAQNLKEFNNTAGWRLSDLL
jgi:hypothetical protein